MLLHYILTGGRHPFGDNGSEVESNLKHKITRLQHVSQEADHLVYIMTITDPSSRPSIDNCLKLVDIFLTFFKHNLLRL